MSWDTIIGLEVHAQLKTQSKLFSGAASVFGQQPNSQASYIDVGLPGVLPVLNQQAVICAIRFGLAVDATIHDHSIFERKNYFYPDLPKGYQISQYLSPIVTDGVLYIEQNQPVNITRAHLEEDAGKSIHDPAMGMTGIDFNRAGMPLLEIVTSPCLSSAEEAVSYLKHLHRLLVFLDICDGNMQEGSFRCDVNISLKPKGQKALGIRTEIKNLNSFKFIAEAICFEQSRQAALLEDGQSLAQETRLYSPEKQATYLMRAKEQENDYRYFPDPDLLPIHLSSALLDDVKQDMPENPKEIEEKLKQSKLLNDDDVVFLLSSPHHYRLYKDILSLSKADEKTIVNWLKGPYAQTLKEKGCGFDDRLISVASLGLLLDKLVDKTIGHHTAKQMFMRMCAGENNIQQMISEALKSGSQDKAQWIEMVENLFQEYPQQYQEFLSGKDKLLAFFVGQAMKKTKGKGDPAMISECIQQVLKNKKVGR